MAGGVIFQAFEWYQAGGGWLWKDLASRAEALKAAGFSALWLPPLVKAAKPESVGYDTYDLWDLGEFDQKGSIRTKYGTKDELLACVQALRTQGLRVYADVVLNHKTGADGDQWTRARRVDSQDRRRLISDEMDVNVWTSFTFPGRGGRYSDFRWSWEHFTGVDYERSRKDRSIHLFQGKHWAPDVDPENGNFDYLMFNDVDVNHPEVRQEFLAWGRWVLETLGLQGFRLDAVKHISAGFFNQWLDALKQDHRDLFALGEYWSGDLARLTHYLDQTQGRIHLFDVPLHFRFSEAAKQGAHFDHRTLTHHTLTATAPLRSVTFVDNHDTQPDSDFDCWVGDSFKVQAYAFILLGTQGYPCVFWGDYYGIPHSQYPGHKEALDRLLRLRHWAALGPQKDLVKSQALGWVRLGVPEEPLSGLALVISAGDQGTLDLEFGGDRAHQPMYKVLGRGPETLKLDAQGRGTFPGFSVYTFAPWDYFAPKAGRGPG